MFIYHRVHLAHLSQLISELFFFHSFRVVECTQQCLRLTLLSASTAEIVGTITGNLELIFRDLYKVQPSQYVCEGKLHIILFYGLENGIG